MQTNESNDINANDSSHSEIDSLFDEIEYLDWLNLQKYNACSNYIDGFPNLIEKIIKKLEEEDDKLMENSGFWTYMTSDIDHKGICDKILKKWFEKKKKTILANLKESVDDNQCFKISVCQNEQQLKTFEFVPPSSWRDGESPEDESSVLDYVIDVLIASIGTPNSALPENYQGIIDITDQFISEIGETCRESKTNE